MGKDPAKHLSARGKANLSASVFYLASSNTTGPIHFKKCKNLIFLSQLPTQKIIFRKLNILQLLSGLFIYSLNLGVIFIWGGRMEVSGLNLCFILMSPN